MIVINLLLIENFINIKYGYGYIRNLMFILYILINKLFLVYIKVYITSLIIIKKNIIKIIIKI